MSETEDWYPAYVAEIDRRAEAGEFDREDEQGTKGIILQFTPFEEEWVRVWSADEFYAADNDALPTNCQWEYVAVPRGLELPRQISREDAHQLLARYGASSQ